MNETEEVLLISLSVCMIIILYGKLRCTGNFIDPLTIALSEERKNLTDGWAISHFLFFFIITALYPSHFLLLQIGGILWEMAEFLNETHPFYLTKCDSETNEEEKWWYGRKEDLLMNFLGGLIGLMVPNVNFF